MSTLSIILIAAAIFFGLLQVFYAACGYAMLRSGKFRSVKISVQTGIISGACAVLAVLLK